MDPILPSVSESVEGESDSGKKSNNNNNQINTDVPNRESVSRKLSERSYQKTRSDSISSVHRNSGKEILFFTTE